MIPAWGMTPEELFSIDQHGQRQSFQDLVAEGLDHDFSARYPALREVLATGAPRHRAFAAAMLASWGVRDGLLAIIDWAEAPDDVPWHGEPATTERFSGADATFAMLAHALEVSRDARLTEAGALLRVGAARALCLIYDRACFERDLSSLFDSEDALARRARPEIEYAVEKATAASAEPHGFDLAAQAAFLVGPLSRLDDARGAQAAEALLALHPGNTRVGREVAFALGAGSGPATMVILERLRRGGDATLARDAEESIQRRKGIVVS